MFGFRVQGSGFPPTAARRGMFIVKPYPVLPKIAPMKVALVVIQH